MPKTCSEVSLPASRRTLHGPTMGTRWSVTLDEAPEDSLDRLQAALSGAVAEVDHQMSPWRADSDLVRFNEAPVGAWVTLPEAMTQVLARALDVARWSDGAFDPTVGALVDAWGFGAARDTPDGAAIVAARAAARGGPGHRALELDVGARRARKLAPLQLDLCGIAKGFAVDRMVERLRGHGIERALVALDGELRALGGQRDGHGWPVAVEQPELGRRAAHSVLELRDIAVATSGDYRRFFTLQGERVAHTMDPRRAAPLRNEVAAVTVLAPECMSADAWATALLVVGADDGMTLARRHGLEAMFLLRRDGALVAQGCGAFA